MNETSQKAMKFSIIVTTISLMLYLPFKNPAMAPMQRHRQGRCKHHQGDDNERWRSQFQAANSCRQSKQSTPNAASAPT